MNKTSKLIWPDPICHKVAWVVLILETIQSKNVEVLSFIAVLSISSRLGIFVIKTISFAVCFTTHCVLD